MIVSLRFRIFEAMPKGRYVTANDILNRMIDVPMGIGARDVSQNIRHMVDGVAIESDKPDPRGLVMYRRIQ